MLSKDQDSLSRSVYGFVSAACGFREILPRFCQPSCIIHPDLLFSFWWNSVCLAALNKKKHLQGTQHKYIWMSMDISRHEILKRYITPLSLTLYFWKLPKLETCFWQSQDFYCNCIIIWSQARMLQMLMLQLISFLLIWTNRNLAGVTRMTAPGFLPSTLVLWNWLSPAGLCLPDVTLVTWQHDELVHLRPIIKEQHLKS